MSSYSNMLHPRLLLLLLLCSSLPWTSFSLRILLTNNNGYSDTGMPLLRDALIEAGHDVYVFAPETRLNGASVALDLPTVNVTQQSDKEWLVNGYAATCVLIGTSQMAKLSVQPDLILSGINDGYTSGTQDWHSGTIGGALTGLSKGIPSWAILTDSPPQVTEEGTYFLSAAQFVVTLVQTLEDVLDEFPRGVGFKVIYPKNPQNVRGVVLAGNNNYFDVTFDYTMSETVPNQLEANVVVASSSGAVDAATSDAFLVAEGYATVLPIQADISIKATRYNENFLAGLSVLLDTMQGSNVA